MFNSHDTESQAFNTRCSLDDQILEIRSIVTNLEFKREEMCAALDSLQRAVNSISINMTETVNK